MLFLNAEEAKMLEPDVPPDEACERIAARYGLAYGDKSRSIAATRVESVLPQRSIMTCARHPICPTEATVRPANAFACLGPNVKQGRSLVENRRKARTTA